MSFLDSLSLSLTTPQGNVSVAGGKVTAAMAALGQTRNVPVGAEPVTPTTYNPKQFTSNVPPLTPSGLMGWAKAHPILSLCIGGGLAFLVYKLATR